MGVCMVLCKSNVVFISFWDQVRLRISGFPTVRIRTNANTHLEKVLTGTDGRNSWKQCVFQRVTVVFFNGHKKIR